MIATFKANNPYNNFLLFIYGIVLKLAIFLHPTVPVLQPSDGILYSYLLKILHGTGASMPLLYSLISYVLLFLQAISFNAIVNGQRMLQKPTYLVGMSYLLITSLFSEWFVLSSPLIVNTILIAVWSKLCRLHTDPSAKTSIYNIGFAIGVCSFFYYPAIVFALLALVGLAIARPFKFPEWIMVLVGIATPFYFFAAWLFLSDRYKIYHFPPPRLMLPVFYETRWAFTAIVLVLLALLLGLIFIQNNLRRQVVQTRKSWQLIYLYLLVAAVVPFFNNTAGFENWILTAVPISIIVACAFFYPEKKWFPLGIHWAMVAVVIAISYFIH